MAIALPCYCRGTLILTDRGEVPVETLRAGDLIVTLSGERKPVVWIGTRSLDAVGAAPALLPPEAWPVRIAAGALAEAVPHTDLCVSPNHSIHIDGLLIPAFCLLNGATIRAEPVNAVQYFHIELPEHGILFANGAAAESWLDTGNRQFFDNQPVTNLHQEPSDAFLLSETGHCVPCVLDGPAVVNARRAIHARALALGWVYTSEPDLHLMADGLRVDPAWADGDVVCFAIPPACAELRLTSRATRTMDRATESGDYRAIGVGLGQLRVDGIAVDLADLDGKAGWWAVESDGVQTWRWTNGAAALPPGTERVMVTVAHRTIYLAQPSAAGQQTPLARAAGGGSSRSAP